MSLEKQIERIGERADLHRIIDEMGDDAIAMLIVQREAKTVGGDLSFWSYGDGKQTQYLGLIGYASVLMHRSYFTDHERES